MADMKQAEKRTEEALRATRDKYVKLFEASPDAIILTHYSDFRILECNQGFYRLTGYAPEEVIGRTTLELDLWDRSEERERIIEELRDTGRYKHQEISLRAKDGTVRFVLISGGALEIDGETCVLAIGHDVTERRRAEERLLAITEAACGGTYDVDLATDGITFSPEWLAAMGYQVGDLPSDFGAAGIALVHPEDLSAMRGRLIDHLKGRTDVYVSEHRMRMKSGGWRWTQDRGRVTDRDAQGRALRAVGVSIDISERKRVEEARESLVGDLQRALLDIKTLRGLLPVCAQCKNVRDDHGYWHQIETYVAAHSDVSFSHGICPYCAKRLYPVDYRKMYPELAESDFDTPLPRSGRGQSLGGGRRPRSE